LVPGWGTKDVENRSWETKFRGKLLIHAGGTPDREAFVRFPLACTYGAIIGWVQILDCVQNHPSVWAERGQWHWVIGERKLFKTPIPCKGALQLWQVSAEVAAQVREQDLG
jgi:hypothetical protein